MSKNDPTRRVLAHPIMIAVTAMIVLRRNGGDVVSGQGLYSALCERALAVGIEPMSKVFDQAAEYARIPYSVEYDIYCSPEMRDEGRRLYGHLYQDHRRCC